MLANLVTRYARLTRRSSHSTLVTLAKLASLPHALFRFFAFADVDASQGGSVRMQSSKILQRGGYVQLVRPKQVGYANFLYEPGSISIKGDACPSIDPSDHPSLHPLIGLSLSLSLSLSIDQSGSSIRPSVHPFAKKKNRGKSRKLAI